MPSRPKFHARIPAVLEALGRAGARPDWTVTQVAALLGCTSRSALAHLRARRAGRRVGKAWLVTRAELAKLLLATYERYGGDAAARPLLELVHEAHQPDERIQFSPAPLSPPAGAAVPSVAGVRLVPDGEHVELDGPGLWVSGRTVKQLLEGAGRILSQATASREGQRRLEAELLGKGR